MSTQIETIRQYIADHTFGLRKGIEDGASIGTRTSADLIWLLNNIHYGQLEAELQAARRVISQLTVSTSGSSGYVYLSGAVQEDDYRAAKGATE